ncbi:ATP-grasp domain-containing protein [Kitasatospora cystarginea]|uniref:ATP-grasp domain-containing protein n=1 Tax=Kitasatospora cystarginea TaxID=58350 RepID=UPI0031D8DB49
MLDWVHQLHENDAVVVLNDDSPLERWLAAAHFLHQQWPLDGIAALAEIDQDKAAAIAEELELAYHSPETVRAVNDKTVMRERLNAAGVEHMPFRQVSSITELEAFQREVGGPLLLKPSRGRASTGIAVAHDAGELAAALEVAMGASAPRLEPSPPIAERYVAGPEFSIEAITHRGVHYVFAVTEKFKDDGSKVETGHVVPARIPQSTSDQLVAHVRACLDALGVERGITHSEVILGSDGPVLVETHLRQAGDSIVQLTESATGVNLTDLVLRQLLGVDLAALPEVASRTDGPHYLASGAIRYLTPELTGRLAGIDGLAQARAIEGVIHVDQLVSDGAELNGLQSSYSRLASARVEAKDADDAVRLAEEALNRLSARAVASS